MKVICVDGRNCKLIEGQAYDAIVIQGTPDNSKDYGYVRVELRNGDIYTNMNRFTTEGGKSLEKISIDERTEDDKDSNLRISSQNVPLSKELVGEWVLCVNDARSKQFIKGNYYKIEATEETWGWHWTMKLEGVENFHTTNKFRLLTKIQKRNIKIDIIGGKEISVANFDRKFDVIKPEEKIKIIIDKLYKAKKEISKNRFSTVSIEDYIVEKDKVYGINREDIEEVKKIKISDLFNQ